MRVLQVDIVVPVRNEERDLAPSVRRLVGYLRESFPFSARVTVADNGSTDATWAVATRLARELPEVRAVHMEQAGRGRALRAIWSQSEAEILAYMDVDLSTDLNALLPLVAPLLSGHSDVAIGTRLARGSRVVRGPRREVISRCYNMLLHATLGARFSDAQCGFKAIRADRARLLLPLTEDTGWFFDTELLILAERAGLRIHEVPVDWVDDSDSRVDILATALAYLLLYLGLRGVMAAQLANAVSLLVTAVGNTAVNRRFTFGIRGRPDSARHQARGLIAFGTGLLLTSAALAALHMISPRPPRAAEVTVLLVANLAATAVRFALYRRWVFRHKAPPAVARLPAAGQPAAAPPAPQPTPSTLLQHRPVTGHESNILATTDIPEEVKRRPLPGLKTGVSTPPIR